MQKMGSYMIEPYLRQEITSKLESMWRRQRFLSIVMQNSSNLLVLFSLSCWFFFCLPGKKNPNPCCAKVWPASKEEDEVDGAAGGRARSKPWATRPPNSARPWQVATRLWHGSCTKETLSSGTAWTRTHLTESSTTTTRPCTTSAATAWHVCSGKTSTIQNEM